MCFVCFLCLIAFAYFSNTLLFSLQYDPFIFLQHYLFFCNINFIFLHYLEFSCFLFYLCEKSKPNHIDPIPCEIDLRGVLTTFYKVIRALASSKTCTERFCSSLLFASLPMFSLPILVLYSIIKNFNEKFS